MAPVAFSGTIFRFRPRLEIMEDRTLLSTFTVTNTADSGPGSLSQAILDSNSATGGTNTIDFDIPGIGVQTIDPTSPLPSITSPVLIDGFSQPGYSGTPIIEINGARQGVAGGEGFVQWLGDGLTITGSDITVRGLDINNFHSGVGIAVSGTGNWIYGDFLGTDPTGTLALNNYCGIQITGSSNRVGADGESADNLGERNLISGNGQAGGVFVGNELLGIPFGNNGGVVYGEASQNIVAGNLIGTDVTGTHPLGNGGPGVDLYLGAASNWIGMYPHGGVTPANEGNVIADNGSALGALGGIVISGDANVVAGNEIGTDATGSLKLPNQVAGINVGGSDNTIGGTVAGAGNLITNNGGPGVGVGGVGDQITGNRIFGNTGQAIDLGDDGVTYNFSAPRQGPNNLQNFPIVVSTADGQLRGSLSGSAPDTSFHLEFFASSGYGPGGAGEAEDYLGSLEVTTDAGGQAVFNVPYSPPAILPTVTATATDPQGNTSEVSAQRRAAVQAPTQIIRQVPGRPVIFSSTSGDAIALQDPDAGPLDPAWDLTLSVSAGTLALSGTAGLVGSGDGTDSLHYRGPLSALDAALAGLSYTPSPESPLSNTLSLLAQSGGTPPVQAQAQIIITDGIFRVTTTADSGPGSLRQAIFNSDTATGGTNTIAFAIPGTGVQTIAPASPLPPLTNPVLIDGFSQAGNAGTPLIELNSQGAGSFDGLTISAANVTIRGLVTDRIAIKTTNDELLVA